jgi:mannose-6-phosphate isomerase
MPNSAFGGDDRDVVKTLKTLMIEQTLPLWAAVGWDAARGGFVEQLDSTGRADREAARRVRVQARQIFCFAKAAEHGWFPEGRAIALRGLEFLLAKAKSPDGRPGFVHKLSPDGATLDPSRDTYDHAFILLALSSVHGLSPDAQVRSEIEQLVEFLEGPLRSDHGGYAEGLPASRPRRQNPHMHLFEAMIAAFDATGDASFKTRATELFDLFAAKFYDEDRRVLAEYFEDDWAWIEPVRVEPGHQAEWVWLLGNYQRLTGCSTTRYRIELMASTLRYRDASGALVDEGDSTGRITKSTRRFWPQTEFAKAWTTQANDGEPDAPDRAREALGRLRSQYLGHPVRGGWYDQFDQNGRSLVETIPASTFYHLLVAVFEADQAGL